MKYIIDVPDGTKWIEAYYTVDHFQYQGQAIIVDSLIPYTEPDLSPLVDEAVEAIEDEVWNFVDFMIHEMDVEEREECFGESAYAVCIHELTYQGAKAEYDEWKKQKDEKKTSELEEVVALANKLGIHRLYSLVKEIRGE